MQVGEISNRMPQVINLPIIPTWLVFLYAPPPAKLVLEAMLCNSCLQYSLNENMTDHFVLSLACAEQNHPVLSDLARYASDTLTVSQIGCPNNASDDRLSTRGSFCSPQVRFIHIASGQNAIKSSGDDDWNSSTRTELTHWRWAKK